MDRNKAITNVSGEFSAVVETQNKYGAFQRRKLIHVRSE
jgi:hypothetical protein